MDFDLVCEEKNIADIATDIANKYGPEYWSKKQLAGEFPLEFIDEIGNFSYLSSVSTGACQDYCSGPSEVDRELDAMGCGGCSGIAHLFGALSNLSILSHCTEEQKQRYLPLMAQGQIMVAFGLSESDAANDKRHVNAFAHHEGDNYVINGNRWFITSFEEPRAIMLVTRTSSFSGDDLEPEGISMFLVDYPNDAIKCTSVPKHGLNYYQSYELVIDNLRVDKDCLIGEEGKGLYQMLQSSQSRSYYGGGRCNWYWSS